MKTIYKYPLHITDTQVVHVHHNAPILSVGKDPQGQICLWAAVDTERALEMRRIVIVGTGNLLPDGCEFLGTVNDGPFVWHVFEQVE